MIVKIYLGLSLLLLWAVWGQFIFGQFLDSAYISEDLQAPSYVVVNNYRVFNLLHLSIPRWFPLFQLLLSLQCLISALTQGDGGGHFFRLTCSVAVGREGHCKQITLACAHSVSATLGLFPPTLLRLQVAPPGTVRGHLGCMHLPGLSCSGSGTRVVLRGADSVGLGSSLDVWVASKSNIRTLKLD